MKPKSTAQREIAMSSIENSVPNKEQLTSVADALLLEANKRLDRKRKASMGQFMTPSCVSQFMASFFEDIGENVDLLDAGAGVGALTAAFVQRCCEEKDGPDSIISTAFELEPVLQPYLAEMLMHCQRVCECEKIAFTFTIEDLDFIKAGQRLCEESLFSRDVQRKVFSHAILNPPYKKIRSSGEHRLLLRSIGIETVNLYAAFVAIALRMLRPGGELVAITPRSFCNGPYFKPFRKYLLESAAIRRIHVFESRDKAFAHDDVLQENVIFHVVKEAVQRDVLISATNQTDFSEGMTVRIARFDEVVKPDDRDMVIHVSPYENSISVERLINSLPCTLREIGLEVSTGPVVDFRLKHYLQMEPGEGTVPLVYPMHCEKGFVKWPQQGRKPNALVDNDQTGKWLFPNGYYALVRRFSSKEEKRRIVATVHNPDQVPGARIGFENHLNLFHDRRRGLSPELAKGLTLFLNSTLVDEYFRQFSGHTQVNAADLRSLRYPERSMLEKWGAMIGDAFPSQAEIDLIIERALADDQETTKAA